MKFETKSLSVVALLTTALSASCVGDSDDRGTSTPARDCRFPHGSTTLLLGQYADIDLDTGEKASLDTEWPPPLYDLKIDGGVFRADAIWPGPNCWGEATEAPATESTTFGPRITDPYVYFVRTDRGYVALQTSDVGEGGNILLTYRSASGPPFISSVTPPRACIDEIAIVTGHFGGGPEWVEVGGVPAAFRATEVPWEIEVAMPPGPMDSSVRIGTVEGEVAHAGDSFFSQVPCAPKDTAFVSSYDFSYEVQPNDRVSLDAFDAVTGAFEGRHALHDFVSSLTLDVGANRLYVLTPRPALYVLDATTLRQRSLIDLSVLVPFSEFGETAIASSGGIAFVAVNEAYGGSSSLLALEEDSGAVRHLVTTSSAIHGLALDESRHELIAASAGGLSRIDPYASVPSFEVPVAAAQGTTAGIELAPSTNHALVPISLGLLNYKLASLDLDTFTLSDPVDLEFPIYDPSFDAVTGRVFAMGGSMLFAFDPISVMTLGSASALSSAGIDARGGRVIVSSYNDEVASIYDAETLDLLITFPVEGLYRFDAAITP